MRRGLLANLPHKAWLSTTVAAVINASGMVLQYFIARSLDIPSWPCAASAGVGIAILSVLGFIPASRKKRPATALYAVNLAAVVAALWVLHPEFAAHGGRWVPFQANKLGCFITALIAPSFAMGVVGIFAHAGSSFIQFHMFSSAIQSGIAFGEPWATLAFGLAGFLTLSYRFSLLSFERTMLKHQSRARMLRKMAQTQLQVKDRMNTPLQTLELLSLEWKKKHPDDRESVAQMDRALEDLREINTLLRHNEHSAKWD